MAKTFYVPNKTGSSFLTGKPVKVYAPNKVGSTFQTATVSKMYCPDSNLTKLFWSESDIPSGALYWHGDLCSRLTGGWESIGVKTWSGSTAEMMVAPTTVYESQTVKITQGSGSWTGHDGVWKTKNKVDISNFTKINIITRGNVAQIGYAGQYTGTHGCIDIILNDTTTGNIVYNGDVDQGHRIHAVENTQGASQTWDWETKTYNLNATALAKGEEYIMLGFYACWGRAYAEVSAVWLS